MSSPNHKTEAILLAQKKASSQPVFLDTETTGFEPNDELVEIAVVGPEGESLLDSLVKPTRSIPPDSIAIHGITDAMVADAPTWAELWPEVQAVLAGKTVGLYNAKFDIRLMRQTARIAGVDWQDPYADQFCVMELFAQYYGDWNSRFKSFKWKSLQFAGKHFYIPEPNAHRAKDDALLTKLVFEKMVNEGGEG